MKRIIKQISLDKTSRCLPDFGMKTGCPEHDSKIWGAEQQFIQKITKGKPYKINKVEVHHGLRPAD